MNLLQVALLDESEEVPHNFALFEGDEWEKRIVAQAERTSLHLLCYDFVLLEEVLYELSEIFSHFLSPGGLLFRLKIDTILVLDRLPPQLHLCSNQLSLRLEVLFCVLALLEDFIFSLHVVAGSLFDGPRRRNYAEVLAAALLAEQYLLNIHVLDLSQVQRFSHGNGGPLLLLSHITRVSDLCLTVKDAVHAGQ